MNTNMKPSINAAHQNKKKNYKGPLLQVFYVSTTATSPIRTYYYKIRTNFTKVEVALWTAKPISFRFIKK
jgi:hypothetical protein